MASGKSTSFDAKRWALTLEVRRRRRQSRTRNSPVGASSGGLFNKSRRKRGIEEPWNARAGLLEEIGRTRELLAKVRELVLSSLGPVGQIQEGSGEQRRPQPWVFTQDFTLFCPRRPGGGGFGAPEGVVSVGYQCWSVVGNRGCGCHSVAEIRLGVLIKVVGMRQGDKATGKALSALKNPPPQLTPCPRPHSPTQTSCWHNDYCVWLVLGVCGGCVTILCPVTQWLNASSSSSSSFFPTTGCRGRPCTLGRDIAPVLLGLVGVAAGRTGVSALFLPHGCSCTS